MGQAGSTRKLTLDNEDPTNVIKVSDSVVNRLKGSPEAVRNRVDKGAPGTEPMPVHPAGGGQPVSPLYPQYMLEPSQTSLQIRQEREYMLRKNDAYWQARINKLEDAHEKINDIMQQEYDNAMHEVKSQFPEKQVVSRQAPCLEGKKRVMACYKQYPNEPMRCALEVQEFADCVDKYRSSVVTKRG